MPYILKEDRQRYDEHIDCLVTSLVTKYNETSTTEFISGHLNYIIFATIKRLYYRLTSHIAKPVRYGYSEMNNIVGMLECCKQEFIRRVVSTHEDKVIIKNGDIE